MHQLHFVHYFRLSPTFLVKLVRNSKGEYRFTKVDLNWTYVVKIAVLISVMGVTVGLTVQQDMKLKAMITYIKVIKIFVTVRCLMLSFTEKGNLAKIFNLVLDIDDDLKRLGHTMSYKLIKTLLTLKIAMVTTIVIVNMIMCLQFTEDVKKCYLHFGSYNVPFIITSMTLLQFSITTSLLRERIAVLNALVAKLTLDDRGRRTFCPNYENSWRSLRNISIIYHSICRGAKLINETYAEQLSLTAARTQIEILNSVHSFVKHDNNLLVYYDLFWAMVAIIEVIIMILPCSSCRRLCKRAPQILNMLNIKYNTKLQFERDMLLLQMQHQEVKFTAGGYFTIDETILLNIVRMTTSYLIILLQFESR